MNRLTRRSFLRLSTTLAAGLTLAACQPIQAPIPVAQDAPLPTPLPEAVEIMLVDEQKAAGFHRGLAYIMDAFTVPGAGIGIVQDGQVIYALGHGVTNVDTSTPVTTNSLFQIADLTHTFTATAAMQLVEQGKLELDMPVVEVLPYFRVADDRYVQITVRHLLTESAGLPGTMDAMPVYDWKNKEWADIDDDSALETYVRSLATVKLNTDPGSVHAFCNMAYDIAGDVIAKASGEVFETYVTHHILQPLGMPFTTFAPEQMDPALVVTPHIVSRSQATVSEIATRCRERAPSVGIFSSVADLNRWLLFNLQRGELEGVRILQDISFDRLWAADFDLAARGPLFVGTPWARRGLGWFTGTYRDHSACAYRAVDLGFHAAVYLLPQKQVGAIALGNQFHGIGDMTDLYAANMASMAIDLLL